MTADRETWDSWLATRRNARDDAGLRRALVSRNPREDLIDLAGNDYLGLSRDPRVIAAAQQATAAWGAGAGASRLVTGTTALHTALEVALTELVGTERTLVTSTGYHANLAALGALADKETTVLSDAHAHASLIDGIRLSRARVKVIGHNDLDGYADTLAHTDGRVLLVVESIYSVLGDAAPLVDLIELAQKHGALLLVDEAHAIGIRGDGAGLLAECGLAGHSQVVLTGTLSKALGAQGGMIAATEAVIDHLINTARPFIFDTALAPAAVGAALAAVELIATEPWRRSRGRDRSRALASIWEVAEPSGWVTSLPMSSPSSALAAQARALEAGVRVGCFRPPSTPDQVARLRATVNAGIEESTWGDALEVLRQVLAVSRGAHR